MVMPNDNIDAMMREIEHTANIQETILAYAVGYVSQSSMEFHRFVQYINSCPEMELLPTPIDSDFVRDALLEWIRTQIGIRT
jgi:hypothetical protein